jgi:hypothetical protein
MFWMLSLNTVTRENFEAHSQEMFQLVLKDGTWPLQLVKVSGAGTAAPNAPREPFALTFRSATPIRLPQGTYRLENDKLGAMEIFLVQSSPTDVEAVFS